MSNEHRGGPNLDLYTIRIRKSKDRQYNVQRTPNLVRIPLPSNGFYGFAVAVVRQSAIYTENSGFASPALGRHISTFRGYRILFSIRNPYINRFTNHFSIHS